MRQLSLLCTLVSAQREEWSRERNRGSGAMAAIAAAIRPALYNMSQGDAEHV
jgi:hypothetical protein